MACSNFNRFEKSFARGVVVVFLGGGGSVGFGWVGKGIERK